MDNTSRYTQARFITLLGAAKNILLSFLKIFFGITGHSHALLADGVHSLADLLIDGMVLIASRFGSKAADSDHPYGHGRIETAFTFLLAFILMLTGVGSAIAAMTTAGDREILEIVIIGSSEAPGTPCGACRQRIREFAKPSALVHMFNKDGSKQLTQTLEELLPHSFGPDHIK